MKKTTTFYRFGDLQSSRLDCLILIPHASEDADFLSLVRETAKEDISYISDKDLYRFLRFEADTGLRELMLALKKNWKNTNFALGVLFVEIPRAFCDLNRPLYRAIPDVLKGEIWGRLYADAMSEIERVLKISDFVFQLHSMNNFDATERLGFDDCVSKTGIDYHITKVYSGRKRSCTILTRNTHGEYLTNRQFDDILHRVFAKNSITLEENTAYNFVEEYPHTDVAHRFDSSFLEITKGSLSINKYAEAIDVSEIVFSEKKIQFYANILSDAILQFLQNK